MSNLSKAILSWTHCNYLVLIRRNPKVAKAVLMGRQFKALALLAL
jgi:hypothetical protein